MMMTEADAKQRWCPFARAASEPLFEVAHDPTDNERVRVASPAASISRAGIETFGEGKTELKVVWPASCACIASACMQWRWESQTNVFDRNRSTSRTGPAEPHGYCGLASKPELR